MGGRHRDGGRGRAGPASGVPFPGGGAGTVQRGARGRPTVRPPVGVAPSTGADRVATARQLVEELPDTVTALFRGEIDYPKAAALAVGVRRWIHPTGAGPVTGEAVTADGVRRGLVAQVEAAGAAQGCRPSLRQHRDAIARAVAALAPTTAEQRQGARGRGTTRPATPRPDGMAWLNIYGPPRTSPPSGPCSTPPPTPRRRPAPDRAQRRPVAGRHARRAGVGLAEVPGTWAAAGTAAQARQARRRAAAAVNVTVPYSHADRHRRLPRRAGRVRADPAPRGPPDRRPRHLAQILTDPASGAVLDYGTTRYTRRPTWSTTSDHPGPDLPVPHLLAASPALPDRPHHRRRKPRLDHRGPHLGCTAGAATTARPTPDGTCPTPSRTIRLAAPTGHTYTVDPDTIGPIVVSPAATTRRASTHSTCHPSSARQVRQRRAQSNVGRIHPEGAGQVRQRRIRARSSASEDATASISRRAPAEAPCHQPLGLALELVDAIVQFAPARFDHAVGEQQSASPGWRAPSAGT